VRTNYVGHDKAYQQRKAAGKPGWSSEDDIATMRTIFEKDCRTYPIPRQGSVLELGCGDGANALWIAQMGYEVSGVDIAPFAIEWAQKKARTHKLTIDFQVGSVLDLANYADKTFDIVLDGHCLHCIIGNDRVLCLNSARQVLKPGGILHINTMCGEVTNNEMLQHFDPASRCLIYQGDLAARYIGLAEDIVEEVRNAGFHILGWRVDPRRDRDDQDMLLMVATLPEDFPSN
jgi:ubiquinone/menaquinone biosynthesis C-methylase UbiE